MSLAAAKLLISKHAGWDTDPIDASQIAVPNSRFTWRHLHDPELAARDPDRQTEPSQQVFDDVLLPCLTTLCMLPSHVRIAARPFLESSLQAAALRKNTRKKLRA